MDLSAIPKTIRKTMARMITNTYAKRWNVLTLHWQAIRELADVVKDPELLAKVEAAQQAATAVQDRVADVMRALHTNEG